MCKKVGQGTRRHSKYTEQNSVPSGFMVQEKQIHSSPSKQTQKANCQIWLQVRHIWYNALNSAKGPELMAILHNYV